MPKAKSRTDFYFILGTFVNHLDAGNLWWERVKPHTCRRAQQEGNIKFKNLYLNSVYINKTTWLFLVCNIV
jgi:hypothetical protein